MLAIGRPRTIGWPGETRQAADQIVVSVGAVQVPELRAGRKQAFGQVSGQCFSAAQHLELRVAVPARTSNIRQVAGVACITVALLSSSSRASRRPSAATSSGGDHHALPPVVSGRNSSSAAMSKASVVTARNVSSATKPGSRRIELNKFTTAR